MLVSYSASPRGIQPILDPDADRLFNAIQVMNLGNNRTQWHNTCQRAVLDTARNAGLGRGDCQGSGRVSTGFVGVYGAERVAAVQGRLREVAGQVD